MGLFEPLHSICHNVLHSFAAKSLQFHRVHLAKQALQNGPASPICSNSRAYRASVSWQSSTSLLAVGHPFQVGFACRQPPLSPSTKVYAAPILSAYFIWPSGCGPPCRSQPQNPPDGAG